MITVCLQKSFVKGFLFRKKLLEHSPFRFSSQHDMIRQDNISEKIYPLAKFSNLNLVRMQF